ncbi:helix-turn-helix domain-containing protein [Devosia rhodophyticola]|uniref:Helix-turn-helix domain-containing protein n=1 Tax=Devosia rhodophyticola TaxID=3026423 RepID=A0ABY7YW52_9HYPH|nr:helix-turn-helix domain-containing protein [Devosia rhodophyticola]WDR05546.1 helix-turn-helix domain-containing protein [Devosia rhodophyticola]
MVQPQTEITPAPHSSPIICGLLRQGEDLSRGFRPTGTKDWLLITTLGGTGYVRAGQGEWIIGVGDLLLIAPDTAQEYGHFDENSSWINIWAHFRPRSHWLNWLNWPQLARGVMLLRGGSRLREIEPELRRMTDIAVGPLRLRLDAAMNALERVLIICDDINPIHDRSTLDRRIKKALEIVGERLAKPLAVEDLSKAVGLSRSRFSVLFSEQLSMSPQSYIEAARLARAAQMLHSSSWPVAQIAEEVGFPNAYYFSTRFRRHFGMPPSVYRSLVERGQANNIH